MSVVYHPLMSSPDLFLLFFSGTSGDQVEDDDHRVCHLAVLSQYAVFKDIIPSYRIRVPTAAEMATKVSKEVHRLRAQEAALLRAYQVTTLGLVAGLCSLGNTAYGQRSWCRFFFVVVVCAFPPSVYVPRVPPSARVVIMRG